MPENDAPRTFWKKALAAGEGCLTVDHFADGLTEAQQLHVETCPRCQAEQAMWNSFNEAPAGEEAGAVRWVAAETQRRLMPPAKPASSWWMPSIRSWAAGLAAAALVLTIGYYSSRPGLAPVPNIAGGNETFRSGAVEILAPKGDLAAAPVELRWNAVPGAASYEVSISEVDGSVLWSTQSPSALAQIPDTVRSRLVPGKTVLWKVSAKNSGGTVFAASPEERFRVKPKSVTRGE